MLESLTQGRDFNMAEKDRPTAAQMRALDEVFQDAVRKGLIVDSGRKKWSQRTGRYEIVWESKLFGKTDTPGTTGNGKP